MEVLTVDESGDRPQQVLLPPAHFLVTCFCRSTSALNVQNLSFYHLKASFHTSSNCGRRSCFSVFQVKMVRPGQVTMRTPTPQAVLKLPVVTPEKAVILATSTNEADGALGRIGADTSLLNKKDTTIKAPGKDEQTGGLFWNLLLQLIASCTT